MFQIQFELGVIYKITYNDGSVLQFIIIGGPNLKIKIIGGGTTTLPEIIQDFMMIEKIVE